MKPKNKLGKPTPKSEANRPPTSSVSPLKQISKGTIHFVIGDGEDEIRPLTEFVETNSREYVLAVTAFLLRHSYTRIVADNPDTDFLTAERIVEGLKRHASIGCVTSDRAVPDIAADDVCAVVGLGGWELPWTSAAHGLAYDLRYTEATPMERAAVQVFLFSGAGAGMTVG